MDVSVQTHPTASVSPDARVAAGTRVWHHAQVREGARLGSHCIIGKGVYIDFDVRIGDNVKIQNYVSIYHGVEIEDGVFVGPHVCFTNDKVPRAVSPDGTLKKADDWDIDPILVKRGASLGANATILPGVIIGEWALVGAGSVVTKDVPQHGLVVGSPARLVGFVCFCGEGLQTGETKNGMMEARCSHCEMVVSVPVELWREAQ